MRRFPSSCRHPRIAALAGFACLAAFTPPAPAAPPVSDTVLVKVAGDAGPEARAEIAQAIDAEHVRALPGGWRVYTLPGPETVAEVRADLADAEAAVRVQLPVRVRALGAPSDPLFPAVTNGYQWALANTGAWNGGVPGADISAVDGWARDGAAAPVTVAVVDTGVQTTHPDLAGRVWVNPGEVAGNGMDDDHNGLIDDVNGWDFANGDASVYDDAAGDRHGTHVAGVIAAARGNGVGVAGVADNARVMPLKFIASDGSGWNVDAIDAIHYAVDHGARVINASFGGPAYDQALCDAIDWAGSQGVLVVAAAGNSNRSLDTPNTWPAQCPSPTMLTVGAFTHTGGLAGFSNFSATQVDIAAPGQFIVSTVPGGYDYMSGTSMATPHVAGVAAAVIGRSPALTPAQARQAILDGAVTVPALTGKVAGAKRLDLDGALAAVGVPAGPDTDAPSAFGLTAPEDGSAVAGRQPVLSWEATTDAGRGLSHYRLLIDGAVAVDGLTATQAAPPLALTPGVHVWAVEAVDRAGNMVRTAERTLLVDTRAPGRFALLQPAAGAAVPAGRVTVRWTASADDGSGLARYEVLVDRRVAATTAGDADRVKVTLPAGRHAVAVRAVDGAGNAWQTPARTVTAQRPGAQRSANVRVAPSRARVGSRPVIRIRSTAAGAARLRVHAEGGRPLGGLRLTLRRGRTTVVLPAGLSARLGTGSYTVRLRSGATPSASGELRVTG